MAHWLLQTNSKDERVTPGTAAWPIRRHRERVEPGDGVVVWRSGRGGGVVAAGVVSGKAGDHTAIDVTLDRVFPVIGRETLKADERFAGAQVLRAPGGGNPLPVDQPAWEAIEERIPPQGPVAATVRGAAAAVAAGATAVREALRTAVKRN
ncbi:EVE domain-containing protein [Symbioplanes lichenis]|uniref:EVE domain-containing protein n=1 Tax=Symbioplanes lichenis TaxID=1629072 RepID=UPI00273A3C9C|nr:EVE domain-containing protein [Actinoplanes lichenis]